jgi:hypothetical protein
MKAQEMPKKQKWLNEQVVNSQNGIAQTKQKIAILENELATQKTMLLTAMGQLNALVAVKKEMYPEPEKPTTV